MKRPAALGIALAVQAGVLGAVALPRLSVRLTGEEYRLRVMPVDPIDPFRGAYVDLNYAGFDGDGAYGRVYVALRRDGDAWIGTAPSERPPADGPYVACEGGDWRLDCGIESWFVSQAKAREAELELADGGVAVVRIDGSGRAVLVRVEG